MAHPLSIDLGPALRAPLMETMNFLNEAAARFPDAISFASGRPPDAFADASAVDALLERYVEFRARSRDVPRDRVWRELGQYGDTNGAIGDLVARWLKRDEGVDVEPGAIMITNGFQEALHVVLLGLCDRGGDVVIAEDPAYVGLAGAAAVTGVEVEPMPVDRPVAASARAAIDAVRRRGRSPRALYVIPDHSNPSGRCMTVDERREVLDLAEREDLLVLEDSAYRAFSYEEEPRPSLKAMDRSGRVLWLGSFAKVFMPGVRLGFLVADQRTRAGALLAQELSKVKSFVSVLTSPIAQAIVGGLLVEHDFSLKRHGEAKVAECGRRRARMLAALERSFDADRALAGRVSWNRPAGGFFVVATLPFEFGRAELTACARDYGVVVTPMSFFTLSGGFRNQVRLAFSNASLDDIDRGVERFHRFVRDRAQDARDDVSSPP